VDHRAGCEWSSPEHELTSTAAAWSSPWLHQNEEEDLPVLTEVFGGQGGDRGRPAMGRNKRQWWSAVWGEWRHRKVELDGATRWGVNGWGVGAHCRAREAVEWGEMASHQSGTLNHWLQRLKGDEEAGWRWFSGGSEGSGVVLHFLFDRAWEGDRWRLRPTRWCQPRAVVASGVHGGSWPRWAGLEEDGPEDWAGFGGNERKLRRAANRFLGWKQRLVAELFFQFFKQRLEFKSQDSNNFKPTLN
jgi:transposase